MPHLFFHVRDGARSPDQDGSDVIDIEDARRQALHMAGVLLQEQSLGHSPVSPLSVEVADESGNIILSVEVSLTYRSDPHRSVGSGRFMT